MSVRLLCSPCARGDCGNHRDGGTMAGVMGGWSCPCRHTEEERQRRHSEREQLIAGLLGEQGDDARGH